jgi:tRNA A37 N6-isopentenylltransferase MiaA
VVELKHKIGKAVLTISNEWAEDSTDDDISSHAEKIFQELLPKSREQLPEDIKVQISTMINNGLLDQIDSMIEDGELAEPAIKLVKQQVGRLFSD